MFRNLFLSCLRIRPKPASGENLVCPTSIHTNVIFSRYGSILERSMTLRYAHTVLFLFFPPQPSIMNTICFANRTFSSATAFRKKCTMLTTVSTLAPGNSFPCTKLYWVPLESPTIPNYDTSQPKSVAKYSCMLSRALLGKLKPFAKSQETTTTCSSLVSNGGSTQNISSIS